MVWGQAKPTAGAASMPGRERFARRNWHGNGWRGLRTGERSLREVLNKFIAGDSIFPDDRLEPRHEDRGRPEKVTPPEAFPSAARLTDGIF